MRAVYVNFSICVKAMAIPFRGGHGACEGWLCVLAYEHMLDTPIWNDPHDGCQDID